jgi:hypothetical protein
MFGRGECRCTSSDLRSDGHVQWPTLLPLLRLAFRVRAEPASGIWSRLGGNSGAEPPNSRCLGLGIERNVQFVGQLDGIEGAASEITVANS